MAYKSKNYNLELLTRNDFVDAEKHISENFKKLDEIIFETSAKIQMFSNPNLLINGDFQVWQRGIEFNYAFEFAYCADRWAFIIGNNDNIAKGSNCLVISTSVDNAVLRQDVENYEALRGKNVTISCEVETDDQYDMYIYDGLDTQRMRLKNGINQITHIINKDATLCTVGYACIGDARQYLKIKWAKLELGSYATPFVPRLYGEELAQCQRYYETINSIRLSLGNTSYTTNTMEYGVPYKARKRVTPNVVIYDGSNNKNKVSVRTNNDWIDDTDFTTIINEDAVTILTNGDYKGILFSKIELDAEIYQGG